MARIRTIKPGFFDSLDTIELSMAARLLFIGLWTQADRRGRLLDEPRRLKMRLFPADDVNIEALLDELIKRGMLVRYEAEGRKILWVRSFEKHQRPHVKEGESELPPFEQSASKVPAPDEHLANTPDSGVGNGEQKGDGKGAQAVGVAGMAGATAPAPRPPEAEPWRGVPLGHRSRGDVAWPGRPPVPGALHAEFIVKLAGDESEARARLMAWYPLAAEAWANRAIGDSDFEFWRARFKEWVGSTRTSPTAEPPPDVTRMVENLKRRGMA